MAEDFNFLEEVLAKDGYHFKEREDLTIVQNNFNSWVTIKRTGKKDLLINPAYIIWLVRK